MIQKRTVPDVTLLVFLTTFAFYWKEGKYDSKYKTGKR